MRCPILPLLVLVPSVIGLEDGSTRQKEKDLKALRSLKRGQRQVASVSCTMNTDCSMDKICNAGSCIDPCSLMSCGQNALCTISNHMPSCECPECYKGEPNMGRVCEPDPQCNGLVDCVGPKQRPE